MKQTNISVFIPHNGCKTTCSFCNQRTISGHSEQITPDALCELLKEQQPHLLKTDRQAQIAFFGGSFTAIDREYMCSLLEVAQQFVKDYPTQFVGIRCSTRPDCIDKDVLTILKDYGMTAIELGAQSMSDEVLCANRRGHTAEDVRLAAGLIKSFGFELGLQMMTGLYKDTPDRCIYTAEEFIKLSPDTVRIYPTVILKGTELDELKEKGIYKTFGFDETIDLCAELLEKFTEHNIPVIRMGLHASEDIEKNMTGGVYHPALREIVESRLFLKEMLSVTDEGGKYIFYTDKSNISKITGQGGYNRGILQEKNITFKIKEEKGTRLRAERIF